LIALEQSQSVHNHSYSPQGARRRFSQRDLVRGPEETNRSEFDRTRAQIGRIHWIRLLLRSRRVCVGFEKRGYLIASYFHNRFPSIGFDWKGDD